MRTNGIPMMAAAVFIFLLMFIADLHVTAQARYEFRNGTRISGTDRRVGALYRFSNVNTGIDALVNITAITGGLTLTRLDGTSSGFNEALQPEISIPARSNGYIEFTITFVTTGTLTPTTQAEVAITPIDVDGELNKVYEFDEIFLSSSGYVDYNLMGGALQLNYLSANLVQGINTAGITYNGVDTSAKQVMFSVVNANVSSVILRVGANNVSGQSQDRLRSIYFQRFLYPNSVLNVPVTTPARNNNSISNTSTFKVFPSIFNNTVRINFNAIKPGVAHLRLVNYAGIIVKQQSLTVEEGNNKFIIDNWGNIPAGNYIAIITQNTTTYRQKMIKQ
jgi:hypothetical protein